LKLKPWIQAARLRTLPLSVSGIVMGCGLSQFNQFLTTGAFTKDYSIFILCLLTTISFQVLSNFANDYGDGVKGTDANRKGEKRLVASGEISPQAMKNAMTITAAIALILSILTLYTAFGFEHFISFSIFIFLGIASIIAAIKYTVGANAYGYSGFGDLFVFLFFGLVSTVGGYFLYTQKLNFSIFLPAISVGLLSVAVLNLNNMRDQIEDKKNNKNTLVVKLGSQKAKFYHFFLIITSLITAITFVNINYIHIYQFTFIIAFIPLLIHLIKVFKTDDFTKLDPELKKVALSTFMFSILFIIFN